MTKPSDGVQQLLVEVAQARPRAIVSDEGIYIVNRAGALVVKVYVDEVEGLIDDLRKGQNDFRRRLLEKMEAENAKRVSGKGE